MNADEERSAFRWWRPSTWRTTRVPEAEEEPSRTKEELAHLLNIPGGSPRERLRMLILGVLIQCTRQREAIVAAAERCQVTGPTLEALLKGEIAPGLPASAFSNVLDAWGADKAQFELGQDLFAEAWAPVEAASAPGGDPPRPDEPGERSGPADDPPSDGQAGPAPVEKGPAGDPPDSERAAAGDGVDERLHPEQAASPEELRKMMRVFRAAHGQPPFAEMKRRINDTYAISTLSMAAAPGGKLPTLQVYVAFLRACGATDDELVQWQRAWSHLAVRQLNEE